MDISRIFANILTDDVVATREFFVNLLGLKVAFDSDWFVNLTTGGSRAHELGIWRRDHELIPNAVRQARAEWCCPSSSTMSTRCTLTP